MKSQSSELLLIALAFVLSPAIAGLVALPIFYMFKSPLWAIVIGSVVGLGLYVVACVMHYNAFPDNEEKLASIDVSPTSQSTASMPTPLNGDTSAVVGSRSSSV